MVGRLGMNGLGVRRCVTGQATEFGEGNVNRHPVRAILSKLSNAVMKPNPANSCLKMKRELPMLWSAWPTIQVIIKQTPPQCLASW